MSTQEEGAKGSSINEGGYTIPSAPQNEQSMSGRRYNLFNAKNSKMEQHETNRHKLAEMLSCSLNRYFCMGDPSVILTTHATEMSDTLRNLGLVSEKALPALAHVVAHYAATSNDPEAIKRDTLAALTGPGTGAVQALSIIAHDCDRLCLWADFFEVLAKNDTEI
jgi:hypothetical protein